MTPAGDHWSNLIPEIQNSSFKSCFCKRGGCVLIKVHGRGDSKTTKKGAGDRESKNGKKKQKGGKS